MTTLHDARFQEQAIAQWRDWRRFLALRRQLLDLRDLSAADAFEAADAPAERAGGIKAQLAAIPADTRALFDRAVDERRRETQRAWEAERRAGSPQPGLLDPDEVERAALTALLAEADGVHANGLGQVPLPDGWYEVEADRLRDLPDEAVYRLSRPPGLPGPLRAAAVALVLLAGVAAMVWATSPGAPAAPPPEGLAPTLVNGQPALLWVPRAIHLSGPENALELPVALDGADAPAEAARWQPGAPPTVCVPGGALAGAVEARLDSQGDLPARVYALNAGPADLVLLPCDGDPAGQRVATFVRAEQAPAELFGQAVQLRGGAQITPQALAVVGPGQDPGLPPGRASVVATVETAGEVDWSQLNPTLRLPDGQDVLPSAIDARDGEATLRYLVPLFAERIERVSWGITDPADGAARRWHAALAPPPTRPAVVAAALANVTASAARADDGQLLVMLTVVNGPGELALAETDLVVTQGQQRAPLPALAALREPLQPGERRAVELQLAAPPGQQVTLSVGAFVFEVIE